MLHVVCCFVWTVVQAALLQIPMKFRRLRQAPRGEARHADLGAVALLAVAPKSCRRRGSKFWLWRVPRFLALGGTELAAFWAL